MLINEFETIDNLGVNNLKIIQNETGFKYGTDAVMLSKFSNIRSNGRVLDLCSGSGIIPILLTAFKNPCHITSIEYFPHVSDMARRSVIMNNLEEKIEVLTGDVKDYKNLITAYSFDNVTVNPPYKIADPGFKNEDIYTAAARHEILLTLADVVEAAEYALKFGGKLSMVNRVDRLSDVFFEFKKNKIEPKRICFITTKLSSAPKIFMIEGIKGGKSGMVVEPPEQYFI